MKNFSDLCMTIIHRSWNAARVTFHSIPSLSSRNTAAMQMLVEPLLSTFLYLLLSGIIGSHLADQHNLIQATLAAVLGSCSISTSMVVSEALAWDRFEGTTPFVLLASRASWSVWMGRIAALVVVNLISNATTLFITLLLVDAHSFLLLPWGYICTVLVFALVSSTGFGIAVAAISMLLRDIYTLPNLLSALLPIIGGVIAPFSIFPAPLRAVLSIIPLPHITESARILSNSDNSGWLTPALTSLGVGIAWAIIGFAIWRISLRIQRRRGTLTNLGI